MTRDPLPQREATQRAVRPAGLARVTTDQPDPADLADFDDGVDNLRGFGISVGPPTEPED